MDDELISMIDKYAAFNNLDRSKAIREILKVGITNKSIMELQNKWSELMQKKWLDMVGSSKLINEGKSLIMERDEHKCQKCNSTTNLQVYSIDRDMTNNDPTNLIVLCKDCASWADKYRPKRRAKEDFLEWFFLM